MLLIQRNTDAIDQLDGISGRADICLIMSAKQRTYPCFQLLRSISLILIDRLQTSTKKTFYFIRGEMLSLGKFFTTASFYEDTGVKNTSSSKASTTACCP